MGRREWYKKRQGRSWLGFTRMWPNSPGFGRWMKRRLSKARRRYIKSVLRTGRGKEPTRIESEVNWKGW